jgi:60 kDa SS-A/Ro ribonucleoprotein
MSAGPNLLSCIEEDGERVINEVVNISQAGRAPKNDPALFVLALAMSHGDQRTRRDAAIMLDRVARIGTHLFHFAEYVDGHRGWGRVLKQAVADWYTSKSADDLAYQMVKYQQRDGWSHKDLLRLSHPKPPTKEHELLYGWAVGKIGPSGIWPFGIPGLVQAYEAAKTTKEESNIIRLIDTFGLTREMIPTKWLNSPDVWAALLPKMPLGALVRNLGKMTSIGLIKPMTVAESHVVGRLSDAVALTNARIHPIQALVALRTYQSGHGVRGSLSWSPSARVIDALDSAFYLCFGNVRVSNKRTMLALDVSGSMAFGGAEIGSMANITAREMSAAMALVTARTEPMHMIMGFAGSFMPLNISVGQRLDDAVRSISNLPFGRTDCALPMLYAMEQGIEVDTFVVYTDNETWYGRIHPVQALEQYRQKTGIPAKLVVVGMVANEFTIADPLDGGMLDVVGMDTATPNLITVFSIS